MNTTLTMNPKGRRRPSRSDKDEKSEVGRLVMRRVGAKVDDRSDRVDSSFGRRGGTVKASTIRSAPSRKPKRRFCEDSSVLSDSNKLPFDRCTAAQLTVRTCPPISIGCFPLDASSAALASSCLSKTTKPRRRELESGVARITACEI